MRPVYEALSRLGALIGNVNDRRAQRHGWDTRSSKDDLYRMVDRFSSLLYTLPNRRRR